MERDTEINVVFALKKKRAMLAGDDRLNMTKLALNLSFALDNFQREEARRDAENALRESETRFRDFAHAAGEYV